MPPLACASSKKAFLTGQLSKFLLGNRLQCSSLTWPAQTWNLSKVHMQKINSWVSRQGARIKGVKRHPDEDLSSFWRRLHREGKQLLYKYGVNITDTINISKYRFAGHIAMMNPQDPVASMARTRNLPWWRYHQARWDDKHSGLHPQRFNALNRWEEVF